VASKKNKGPARGLQDGDRIYVEIPKGNGPVEMGTELTLAEWLVVIADRKRRPNTTMDYQFPTDAHRKEYLKEIGARTDAEIRFLLRKFLIGSGTLGHDYLTVQFLAHAAKRGEELPKSEFTRRLFGAALTKGKVQPWEGITWVLDLLPQSPRKALDAIDAYFDVHVGFMPDGRLMGMSDARAVIRAKYILVGDVEGSERALERLTPRELEVLVAALYRARGYATRLTPPSKDGGRDVIATRRGAGQRERCLIECKHHGRPVGVKDARALLFVVAHERSSKGTIVATSQFTGGTKKLAAEHRQLDLVPRKDLVRLLNEHLGSDWPLKVDELLAEEARRHAKTGDKR
jgi:restriction system protein